MRVLGRLRCAPEISLGGQVSRVSKAVGPIMHRREKGRLHSGVERDIAESDIVHLPLSIQGGPSCQIVGLCDAQPSCPLE